MPFVSLKDFIILCGPACAIPPPSPVKSSTPLFNPLPRIALAVDTDVYSTVGAESLYRAKSLYRFSSAAVFKL